MGLESARTRLAMLEPNMIAEFIDATPYYDPVLTPAGAEFINRIVTDMSAAVAVIEAARDDHPTWTSETGEVVCANRDDAIENCSVCSSVAAFEALP